MFRRPSQLQKLARTRLVLKLQDMQKFQNQLNPKLRLIPAKRLRPCRRRLFSLKNVLKGLSHIKAEWRSGKIRDPQLRDPGFDSRRCRFPIFDRN